MFGGKLDKQRALEQEALLAARKAPARPLIRSLTRWHSFRALAASPPRRPPRRPGLASLISPHLSPSLPTQS